MISTEIVGSGPVRTCNLKVNWVKAGVEQRDSTAHSDRAPGDQEWIER